MPLEKGDPAPNFEFEHQGEITSLHKIPTKKLVFFFPKAFTPGCTKEACSIQETHKDLKEFGIETIIGVSIDDKKTLEKFKDKYHLDYILVSDKKGNISKSYGVYKNFLLAKISDRVTFIVDEQNRIMERIELGIRGAKSKLGLDKHGKEILDIMKDL